MFSLKELFLCQGLSAALETLQQTQKMRLLNHHHHQRAPSSEEDGNPVSRRGSRRPSGTGGGGSPDRNSSDSGIDIDSSVEELMGVSDFKRRRAIVDALGWQPFTEWFYESTFRLESVRHLSHCRSGVGFPISLRKTGVTHMVPQKQRYVVSVGVKIPTGCEEEHP